MRLSAITSHYASAQIYKIMRLGHEQTDKKPDKETDRDRWTVTDRKTDLQRDLEGQRGTDRKTQTKRVAKTDKEKLTETGRKTAILTH